MIRPHIYHTPGSLDKPVVSCFKSLLSSRFLVQKTVYCWKWCPTPVMSGGRQASLKAAADSLSNYTAAVDCTAECRLEQHSETALSCAYLGNIKLLQHCSSICGNPFLISDALGRNVLHMAASRGHLHLVQWLLTRRKVPVNVADWESNWSALHRSIFYGRLGVAVYLIKVSNAPIV